MTGANSAAVDGWGSFDKPKPLASWYTEGLCDGLGDRLLMFDNSGTPSLELLRFRPLLAAAGGFEDALRQRVEALRAFDHRGFARVRAVERLEGGDLALVSTITTGKRVTEILYTPHGRGGVHPAFAAWLIRELIASVADLHRQGSGIAHGGLSPDRVILTPDGRVVIVEHVLGAALDRLRLPIGRLWQVLGIVAVGDSAGRALLDQRTDVVQVAWLSLSLLLGRRIAPPDYPHRVDTLLDEFEAASRDRAPTLVSALRVWLERALHTTGDVFESAIHAEDGLGDLRFHAGPHGIAFAASRMSVDQLAFHTPQQLPPMHPTAVEEWLPAPEPEPEAADDSSASSTSEVFTMAMAPDFAADVVKPKPPEEPRPIRQTTANRPWPALAPWLVAVVFALLATGEAVWIARAAARADASPAPTAVPIVLDSPNGDTVIVDGRDVGVTPLTLALTPDMRSIRVRARVSPDIARAEPVPAVVETAATSGALPALAQAAASKRGGFRLSSPIELQVLEGERVLGSSVEGPIVTTAGRHELDFVNSALSYRSHQVVEIKAGQIVPMRISPPDGRISVNAVPWAQVLINGNPVGETPLANLPLAIGEHEITFRHPKFGDQTQRVIVKSNTLTRVSVTFAR